MHRIIESACQALEMNALNTAKAIIAQEVPFVPLSRKNRKYSIDDKIRIFRRDGFIDRYSGARLIFPPVLRILSLVMPAEFPFHKNWKTSDCHFAYWQLMPTIDHILPVSRGGCDEETNWVCTSQLRNSAKANWLLDEIGWRLYPSGNLTDWDGMLDWFVNYVTINPKVLDYRYIRSWHKAVSTHAARR